MLSVGISSTNLFGGCNGLTDGQEAILMQEAMPDFMTTGETKLRRITIIKAW